MDNQSNLSDAPLRKQQLDTTRASVSFPSLISLHRQIKSNCQERLQEKGHSRSAPYVIVNMYIHNEISTGQQNKDDLIYLAFRNSILTSFDD